MHLVLHASTHKKKRKEKEKLRKQQKVHHINQGKGAAWEEKPLGQKRKGGPTHYGFLPSL